MRQVRYFSALICLWIPFTLFAQEAEWKQTIPFPVDAQWGHAQVCQDFDVAFIDRSKHSLERRAANGLPRQTITSVVINGKETSFNSPQCLAADTKGTIAVYDDGLGQVLVIPTQKPAFAFGEKGSGIWQLKDITDMVIDSKGYFYLLNNDLKRVQVFSPEGSFITSIAGGNAPFMKPKAIGINGRDEVYVLDLSEDEVVVYMFDVYGNLVNTNRHLEKKQGVTLNKPKDIAVFSNGWFALANKEKSLIQVFDRLGAPQYSFGLLGSKGGQSEFNEVSEINALSNADVHLLAVTDAVGKYTQCFQFMSSAPAMVAQSKRIRMQRNASSRPTAVDMVVGPNGYRYVIPANATDKVVAYKDTSTSLAFTITNLFKDARALAISAEGQLFVADAGAKEVLQFDANGTLVRRFGKDIPEKLREPVSIVVQSNGTIIVADKSRNCLHAWNSAGVYQKIITSEDNSTMRSPAKVQVDSKDQIFVWDDSENCIYKIGSFGWPTAPKRLFAKGTKPGEKPGLIQGFVTDPLDNLHLYNATNGQIEVYTWGEEPLLQFSAGQLGKGSFDLTDTETLQLDKDNFIYYLPTDNYKSQRVFRFLVPPPPPDTSITFDVFNKQVLVYFQRSKIKSVISYGLIEKLANGEDSLVATAESSPLKVPLNDLGYPALHHYGMVSISQSDYSTVTKGFDDYFSYGRQLMAAERYEEGLEAYRQALLRMGAPQRMKEFVAQDLAAAANKLTKLYEPYRGMQLLVFALQMAPDDEKVRASYSRTCAAYFEQLVNTDELTKLSTEAQILVNQPATRPLVTAAIEELSARLVNAESEKRITDALVLLRKAKEWDADNKQINGAISYALWKSFLFKASTGRSESELKADLNEAIRNGKIAYEGLKPARKPYYTYHLQMMEMLHAAGHSDDVETYCVGELAALGSMPDSIQTQYRLQLAKAYTYQEKHRMAAEEYERLTAESVVDEELLLLAGEAHLDAGMAEDGKLYFQRILITQRENAAAIAGIGRSELIEGNYAEASYQLEKALKLEPTHTYWNYYLASSFDRAGMLQKALDHYELCAGAMRGYGLLPLEARVSDTRIKHYRYQYRDCLERLAYIYTQVGKLDNALAAWQDMAGLNDLDATAHAGLGAVHLAQGSIYEAIAEYQKAVALDPANSDYSKALENAKSIREKTAKSNPALQVLELQVDDVYPSLLRNYADVKRLPVGELVVANNTPDAITPTSITVFVKEYMSTPTDVKVSPVMGYSNTRIKLNAVFQRAMLENTSEQPLQLEVVLRYQHKGSPVEIKKTQSFTLHGRNVITWTDKRRLAAFVSNSDEQWIQFSKQVDVMFRDAPTHGINSSLLKALRMYCVIKASRIQYSEDPAQSFATAALKAGMMDYLQYPSETYLRKGGDCDDLVTLYAAALENAGIPTAYIDIPGHVFMAFDTQIKPEELNANGLNQNDVLIAYNRVWIPIETTYLGTQGFMAAWKEGIARFNKELAEGHFPELIPLADAWSVYLPDTYVPKSENGIVASNLGAQTEYEMQLGLMVQNNNRQLLIEMERRYTSEPANVYVKNRYAMLMAQSGELNKARAILDEALSLAPESPVVLNNCGNVYFLLKDYDRAIDFYQLASKVDEKDAGIQINLCKAYLAKGDKALAGASYDKAASLNIELAEIYMDLKNQTR